MDSAIMNFIGLSQLTLTIIIVILLISNTKKSKVNKDVIDRENAKQMDILDRMKSINLTEPLTEKSRPESFEEIIGQSDGVRSLRAALCGPNPQHVILYGPPGVGKTAAARLVLQEAKKNPLSPFRYDAKFVEIDAATLRYDDRGIADPLIGSVHDPIYQGAGVLGIAGIPQPKPGAVTKAHGGILFIDEIGELSSVLMNKLLKVLEDRKVILDSAYYSSEDPEMPLYIKEIFDKGYPADFRLIGATTRSPEEIPAAIRSRCIEIFFKDLSELDIKRIAGNAVMKAGYSIDNNGLETVAKFCSNGREVINLIQLCAGIAIYEKRSMISDVDIKWVIENGQYHVRANDKINSKSEVGVANGLGVYGANCGMMMKIESIAKKTKAGKGSLKVTGIIDEEEISMGNRRVKRKSTSYCSVMNVITVLDTLYDLQCNSYDIHINFSGGAPIDGPSAGITIACAVYSAITGIKVKNTIAMTGELSIKGDVRPVGGVSAKIMAASKAGATTVLIPSDNWRDDYSGFKNINVECVSNLDKVLHLALDNMYDKMRNVNVNNIDILSAKAVK